MDACDAAPSTLRNNRYGSRTQNIESCQIARLPLHPQKFYRLPTVAIRIQPRHSKQIQRIIPRFQRQGHWCANTMRFEYRSNHFDRPPSLEDTSLRLPVLFDSIYQIPASDNITIRIAFIGQRFWLANPGGSRRSQAHLRSRRWWPGAFRRAAVVADDRLPVA